MVEFLTKLILRIFSNIPKIEYENKKIMMKIAISLIRE
jgi:hypothetical protein